MPLHCRQRNGSRSAYYLFGISIAKLHYQILQVKYMRKNFSAGFSLYVNGNNGNYIYWKGKDLPVKTD